MKNYKLLKKETDNIYKTTKDEKLSVSLTIKKIEKKLDNYYQENKDNISKDALLKQHKHLTYDYNSMISNTLALIIGLFSSLLFSFINPIFNELELDSLLSIIISAIVGDLILVIIIIFFMKIIYKAPSEFYTTANFYADKYHAKLIEKVLNDDDFRINFDIDDIKFTDKTQENKDNEK